ncbi:helix-turn-helix domain-containing protein [Kibdelosporangium philippinense]|uniref:Helix-turn-helix domain-containing protein n=1 Tax=Kibdelosporangium philippinense TaxID=211113 RepID=A0ABS8Z4J9_9PSEU|nr:helix-turn-helix domain-containing protein [Kibdelosporangium philippinense]MCE7002851.1 helix-turn-helix domain-containing protein [Kibdelosporangium philippinense]
MQVHEYSGEEFEDIARDSFMPVSFRAGPGFRTGRVAVQEMGEAVTLSRGDSGGPHRMLRTAKSPGDDLLLFMVHLDGEIGVHQNDRFAQLAPGTGVLSESRGPWEIVGSTQSTCMILTFARELLPLRTSEITDSCARGIDPAAPGMQMVSGYLDRLFGMAEHLTAEQRLDAGRAAIDLLAMALRDVQPSVPSGDGSAGVVLEMMRTHVRENLADSGLRVEELARRHHVSVRHVYNLFERIGTTPGAYLREQRLLTARAMLSDPRALRLGISDIADAVGFFGRRTFELAFRREFGMTPGAWRREHLPSDAWTGSRHANCPTS